MIISGDISMKFDHVAIRSSDIARSVEWYKQNLNCQVEYQDETWAMLSVGGSKVAIVSKGQHPAHIAFEVESSLKFPCSPEKVKVHRDNSSYYYGSDPDGNVIEWVAYTDEEE
jgi:catechol-2,3-dioxygenase